MGRVQPTFSRKHNIYDVFVILRVTFRDEFNRCPMCIRTDVNTTHTRLVFQLELSSVVGTQNVSRKSEPFLTPHGKWRADADTSANSVLK